MSVREKFYLIASTILVTVFCYYLISTGNLTDGLLNLGTEFIGIFITVFWLDRRIKRLEKVEFRNKYLPIIQRKYREIDSKIKSTLSYATISYSSSDGVSLGPTHYQLNTGLLSIEKTLIDIREVLDEEDIRNLYKFLEDIKRYLPEIQTISLDDPEVFKRFNEKRSKLVPILKEYENTYYEKYLDK